MVPSKRFKNARGILIDHIKKTYEHNAFPEEWRNLPEVPSSAEIKPVYKDPVMVEEEPEQWDAYQQDTIYDEKLPHNVIDGPWPSTEAYLGAHYQMIREDSVAPLRNAVTEVQANSYMDDGGETCIYTGVTFIGLQFSRRGVASRVEFSCERAGKQIRWDQSKRLLQGTLVALTPERDMFKTICKIATVAARVLKGGLDQDPPSIDIFWADIKDMVIDPVEKYVMVESRQGFFESSRHTMVAMQKLMTEPFSFSRELVELDSAPEAPLYVQENPFMDLSSLERSPDEETDAVPCSEPSNISNVDVIHNFPKDIKCSMDASQMTAFRNMITKRLAIVQGPPGTGKTFVSISGLKVMIRNLGPDDPPIIVAAQTNHALDQLLNHILEFEEEIIRLGGQSDKGNTAIRSRTFFELRKSKDLSNTNQGVTAAYKELGGLCSEAVGILSPLLNDTVITADTLLEHGVITKSQRASLEAEDWAVEQSESEIITEDLAAWLTASQLMPVPSTPSVNFGFPMEEGDIEFEQLQELALETAEAGGPEERDPDFGLDGEWIPFRRKLTGRHNTPIVDSSMRRKLNRCKDLFQIPVAERGQMYRYFEKRMNTIIMEKLQAFFPKYQQYVENFAITKSMSNIKLMQELGIKVVGCTTTGLSKYRGLLSALEPRTLLIEEAAETLESKIIAGMMESLQQLILIGDHKQLQATCTVQALQYEPYYLSVSMFERLVKNSMPFVMLNHQRRMIPDVRKLLCIQPNPFYNDLHDHESVLDRVNNRPPVPGMGGRDTYFFSHNWIESRTFDGSCFNLSEADMIAEFFNYLVLNGVATSKITVLTFYNGQRKTIIKQLKRHPSLEGTTYFNVFTVDSYQGEENDIILLSMVRSNVNLGVGFLDNKNRFVVALSRARRGLYLFGNAITLTAGETTELAFGRDPLFDPLIMFMKSHGRFDIDGGLPVTCARHNSETRIFDVDGFAMLAGGCQRRCEGGILSCGHTCTLLCHPFDHSRVICKEACTKTLPCGHGCSRNCGQDCVCDQCHVAETGLIFVPDNFECWEPDPATSPTSSTSPTKSALRSEESPALGRRQVRFSDDDNPFSVSDVRHDLYLSNSQIQTNGRPIPPRSRAALTSRRPASDNNSDPSSTHGSSSARSTPVKSRSKSSRSSQSRRQGSLSGYRDEPVVDRTHPGFKNWKDYNAKKADKDIDEQQRIEAGKAPKMEPSSVVIKETFRPVIIKNGVRTKDPSGPVRTLIQSRHSEKPRAPQESKSTSSGRKAEDLSLLEKAPHHRRLEIEKSLAPQFSFTRLTAENPSDPLQNFSQQQRSEVAKANALQASTPPLTLHKNIAPDVHENSLKLPTEPLAEQQPEANHDRAKNCDTMKQNQEDARQNQQSQLAGTGRFSSRFGLNRPGSSKITDDTSAQVRFLNKDKSANVNGAAHETDDPFYDFGTPPTDLGYPLLSAENSCSLTTDLLDDFFGPLDEPESGRILPVTPTKQRSPWTSVLSAKISSKSGEDAEAAENTSAPTEQVGRLFDSLSILNDLGHVHTEHSVTSPANANVQETAGPSPGRSTKGVIQGGDAFSRVHISASTLDAKQGCQPDGVLQANELPDQSNDFLMGTDPTSRETPPREVVVNSSDDDHSEQNQSGDGANTLIDFGNSLPIQSSVPQKSLIDESDNVPSFSSHTHNNGLDDDEDLIAF